MESLSELLEGIRTANVKPTAIIAERLERIRRVEQRVHAFTNLTEKMALDSALSLEKRIREGKRVGKLAGLPVAIKDNICVKGYPTTCSSKMLVNYVPPYDATVIRKLLAEDAIIVGKTNMDEFAMGTSTETSHFGPTRNPWNLERVPGGSSGGSAAAVAAQEAYLGLGSDTGGSVRCPASFCSVVGLKPTYGLVSRYGLISYANSLEQIGPISSDVYGCALLFSIIKGLDPRDNTSVRPPVEDYISFQRDHDISDLHMWVPDEFFGEGIHEGVAKTVRDGIEKLEELGAVVREISIPSLKYALPAYYLIAMSEASSNLARYDGLRYGFRTKEDAVNWEALYSRDRALGFGPEVRRRIILGTYALSAGYRDKFYLKALKIRTLIKRDFERILGEDSLIVTPTMPIPPFKLGEKVSDPLTMYLTDICTVPVNLTGMPAISLPCGFVDGLPVGMQLIAPSFREDLLFKASYAFEQSTDHWKRRPSI
jgi:aspartyl-tRNA(Asn)/glutamyl-tRNA(Gln) amidotransferase subunit A